MTQFWCACACILKLDKILWNRSFNFLEWRLKSKLYRSSPRGVLQKKSVLRNFKKFAGKHLCQSLRPWHRCFPVNFAKSLRTPFLQNTSGRLLLVISYCIVKNGTVLNKVSHSGLVVGKMSLKNKSLFTWKALWKNNFRGYLEIQVGLI